MAFNWIEWTEPMWRNLSMNDLEVDEAYINLKSELNSTKSLFLYSLSKNCYKCPYSFVKKIKNDEITSIKLDIATDLSFKLFDKNFGKYAVGKHSEICTLDFKSLGEFGVYNLTAYDKNNCTLVTDKDPVNVNTPFLSIFLIILVLLLCWKIIKKICFKSNEANGPTSTITTSTTKSSRLDSLDILRGMAIVLMIFVNSGGGHYYWMEHAPWNGLHVADIVFPSFLWIMGVCIPISISSQLRKGESKTSIIKLIFVRSVKLFAIGLCLNSIHAQNFEKLRIMGVLQRFGVAYFFVATMHTIFKQNTLEIVQNNFKKHILDFIQIKWELFIGLILIIINLSVILALKVPGCSTGYMGPGGKNDYPNYVNCTGGAIGYIDKSILGQDHLYRSSTAKKLYDAQPFDPEGVFGCILTIVQVVLGLHCGIMLASYNCWKARLSRLFISSVVLSLLGAILCNFSLENGLIPINKNLWSLTYVFVTSAIDNLLLLILIFVVDVKKIWSGFPFKESGKNSIIMYIGHSILHMLPFHWQIGLMNTHFMLLLESLWNTSLWVGISVYLNSKKIFYNL